MSAFNPKNRKTKKANVTQLRISKRNAISLQFALYVINDSESRSTLESNMGARENLSLHAARLFGRIATFNREMLAAQTEDFA